jgi:hypothetical protein
MGRAGFRPTPVCLSVHGEANHGEQAFHRPLICQKWPAFAISITLFSPDIVKIQRKGAKRAGKMHKLVPSAGNNQMVMFKNCSRIFKIVAPWRLCVFALKVFCLDTVMAFQVIR